jgi:hypothetical protein
MPRTIEATQKNAFTLIAKYLRDQGVPIRTRRDLVEYTDMGGIQNALLYWSDAYNQDVMNERKKNAKAKREARNAKQLLQSKDFIEIPQKFIGSLDFTISNVKSAFNARKGKSVVLQFLTRNRQSISTLTTEEQQQVFDIPVSGFNRWFNANVIPFCMLNSEEYKWTEPAEMGEPIRIYLYEGTEILTPEKIQQAFQEGSVNCVIKPMLDWAKSCLEKALGRSSKFEYSKIIRELTEMAETFKLGVTELDLHTIVSRVPVDITIVKPLSNETLFNVNCRKMSR